MQILMALDDGLCKSKPANSCYSHQNVEISQENPTKRVIYCVYDMILVDLLIWLIGIRDVNKIINDV